MVRISTSVIVEKDDSPYFCIFLLSSGGASFNISVDDQWFSLIFRDMASIRAFVRDIELKTQIAIDEMIDAAASVA